MAELKPQSIYIPGSPYYVTIDGEVFRHWRTVPDKKLKPYKKNNNSCKRQRIVKVCVNGVPKNVTLSWCMRQTYFRGLPEDTVLIHIDGCADNYAVWNLQPMTMREAGRMHHRKHDHRCILKIDPKTDEVLEIYGTSREAGRANFMSYQTILDACNLRSKRRPGIAADGYRYKWED